jgi:PPOX class probable F420-dependent enzyme
MASLARLATLMPDGSPQLTVMWFRPDGGALRMVAPASAKKVANIERDGRVSVIVEEPDNPYHFVELRGTATILHDDAGARAELVRIATRYIGDRAAGYAGSLSSDPRVIIEITPEKTVYHPGKKPAA